MKDKKKNMTIFIKFYVVYVCYTLLTGHHVLFMFVICCSLFIMCCYMLLTAQHACVVHVCYMLLTAHHVLLHVAYCSICMCCSCLLYVAHCSTCVAVLLNACHVFLMFCIKVMQGFPCHVKC